MTRSRFHTDERGVALVTVLGITFILTLLVTASLAYAVGSMPQAERHEDWHHALKAAESGLEDYVYRLNRNPGYYATATEASPGGNDALDGWASIAGADAQGEFHYDVDASAVNSAGAIDLTVTGRVDGVTRSITARVRPEGFLDYIYFTNYETIDDEDNVAAAIGFNQAGCDAWYGIRPGSCAGIRFVTGDVISGPLRTNDAILIDGSPVFQGLVETRWPGSGGQLWRDNNPTSTPDFQQGIVNAPQLDAPPTNLAIRDQTTGTSPATRGCNYYGPTYIRVAGDRLWVRSPLSASSPPTPINSYCIPGAGLATGGYIDIPDNGVVYVSNDTTCSTGNHPLGMYQANTGDRSTYGCIAGDAFVWGSLDGQLTVATQNDIYVIWDLVYAGGVTSDDLMGLVAQNFINVYHPVSCFNRDPGCELGPRNKAPFTGDPVQPPQEPLATAGNEDLWITPDIHAAIMTVDNSFRVQNWAYGSYFNRFTTSGTPDTSSPATGLNARADLSVVGAISQEFRGVVGTGGANAGTGYIKDYVYDDRLQYLSPPFFIQPTQSQWVSRRIAEVEAPSDLP